MVRLAGIEPTTPWFVVNANSVLQCITKSSERRFYHYKSITYESLASKVSPRCTMTASQKRQLNGNQPGETATERQRESRSWASSQTKKWHRNQTVPTSGLPTQPHAALVGSWAGSHRAVSDHSISVTPPAPASATPLPWVPTTPKAAKATSPWRRPAK